ncbi:VPLPA-CTERM-specific exosortase XrtD [Desulfovibrio inopinatus]|uniref:VPLPA-CTERM-specific exosortase XrtD n=1 Tax=Desulfovibrio inopinatus TaxID=102109 RepID=UPI00068746F1|nr:VPLPA-CTERM-specific exosortase XrtD [Desulfovibrio inopinatus]
MRQLNRYIALLLPAFLFVGLYWDQVPSLISHWNNDNYSYCYLVVPVFLYLLSVKRNIILQSRGGSSVFGFVGILLGLFLYMVGRLGSLETFVYISLWINIVSLLLVWLGYKAWRPLFMPSLVLLFIVPGPVFVTNMLSFQLKVISSRLSEVFLHMLNIPVFREGNIIDLGVLQLQVVDACSGLRFFLPTILISLILADVFLRRALLMVIPVLFAAPVAIVSNAIRIASTGVLVKFVSPRLAEGFFHDFSGWLVFVISIALLAGLCLFLRRFEGLPTHPQQGERSENVPIPFPSSRRMAFVSVLFCVGLLLNLSLSTESSATLLANFDSFPLQIGAWQGKRITLEQNVLDNLWADSYISGTYKNEDTGNILHLLVPFYAHQTTGHTAHAPTSCLLGSGWFLSKKDELPADESHGRNFSVGRMILEKDDYTLLSNFWFEQRGRHLTNEFLNKFYLLWDALTLQRSDGALVRVEMILLPGQSVEQGQRILDDFVARLKPLLHHYLPGLKPDIQGG